MKQKLTLNQYQDMGKRTANPHEGSTINYALGITGESGEVADHIKKVFFHGHEMDKDHLVKELGDVLWYVSNLAANIDCTLEDVALLNIEKLQKRYPSGFDTERSVNREELTESSDWRQEVYLKYKNGLGFETE